AATGDNSPLDRIVGAANRVAGAFRGISDAVDDAANHVRHFPGGPGSEPGEGGPGGGGGGGRGPRGPNGGFKLGGIASGPMSGFWEWLHGREIIIPADRPYSAWDSSIRKLMAPPAAMRAAVSPSHSAAGVNRALVALSQAKNINAPIY